MLLDHILKTDCTSNERQWLRLREEGCGPGMAIPQSLSHEHHKTSGLECIVVKLSQPLQSLLMYEPLWKPGHRASQGTGW